MNFKNLFLGSISVLALLTTSCSEDDTTNNNQKPSIELTGGPFNFTVDLEEDRLEDDAIAVTSTNNVGDQKKWIVTDEEGNILGLPGKLSGPEFNEAGVGTCLVWYISYENGISGLEVDKNVNDLEGNFTLSNSINVVRSQPTGGAILTGGPFEFIVDGTEDRIPEGAIVVDQTNALGSNSIWIVTDETGDTILGTPPSFTAPEFDEAGVGTCYVWLATYNDGVTGIIKDSKISDINGSIYLSNPIKVERKAPTN